MCSMDSTDDDEEGDCYSELHSRWVRTNTEEREQLKDEAGEWRKGRWTADEVKILKRNVKSFKKANHVQDLSDFIFNRSDHKEFYRYIARDIQRPLFAVYRKLVREFDVSNYVGRWTKKGEKELLRLHSIHGNRWATIGKALGVSGRAAQDKYKSMTKRQKKGAWSKKEERKLLAAVRELCGDMTLSHDSSNPSDLSLPPDVTWTQVAELVGSRNGPQCRSKWYFDLTWKKKGRVKQWDMQDDLKLLQRLSSLDVADEDEVEWAELAKGWDSARSPYYLRNRWACLRRGVVSYENKTFEENLDHLMEHQVPLMERKIAKDFVQEEDSD